ncbi:50S ribosomal protein L4 [Candidatus Kaiserbacteria bacterium]|nr:50S ribosomal protein L4 [Candidatus Kaiserbacteria bacterium]
METNIYNQEGKATGTVNLPEAIFGLKWNGDLVHQVVVGMQSNKRTPIAHTKNRGEVRGGGKKPWKQKGTGRARHGSSRSPIWRGGGITFGPRNDKDFSKKINKKMKTKALYVALSQKLRDGEILFIDTLSFTEPKTSEAKNILSALSTVNGFDTLVSKKKNSALLTLNEKDVVVEKSFDNLGNIEVDEVRNLNALDVLSYKYVIITKPEDAISFFSSKGMTVSGSVVEKDDEPKEVAKKVVAKKAVKSVAKK